MNEDDYWLFPFVGSILGLGCLMIWWIGVSRAAIGVGQFFSVGVFVGFWVASRQNWARITLPFLARFLPHVEIRKGGAALAMFERQFHKRWVLWGWGYTHHLNPEVARWCAENLTREPWVVPRADRLWLRGRYLFFRTRNDAFAFKMRWG